MMSPTCRSGELSVQVRRTLSRINLDSLATFAHIHAMPREHQPLSCVSLCSPVSPKITSPAGVQDVTGKFEISKSTDAPTVKGAVTYQKCPCVNAATLRRQRVSPAAPPAPADRATCNGLSMGPCPFWCILKWQVLGFCGACCCRYRDDVIEIGLPHPAAIKCLCHGPKIQQSHTFLNARLAPFWVHPKLSGN